MVLKWHSLLPVLAIIENLWLDPEHAGLSRPCPRLILPI